jgi:hypothetical protein
VVGARHASPATLIYSLFTPQGPMTDHPELTPFQVAVTEQLTSRCAGLGLVVDRRVCTVLATRTLIAHHLVTLAVRDCTVQVHEEFLRVQHPGMVDRVDQDDYDTIAELVEDVLGVIV